MWVKRTLGYVGVLLSALVLNFALPRVAPGNPIDFLLPPEQAGTLTPAQRQQLLAQFGLDKPIPAQFVDYLSGIVHGNFAYSVVYGRPVRDLLVERLPWTLLLVGTATVLATVIATLVGFRSAARRGSGADTRMLTTMIFIHSTPPFFVGMLMILVFSIYLHLFPIFGAIPLLPAHGLELVGQVATRLALPLLTLTLFSLGPIYLVARAALVSEMQEDYVLAAEAKGITPTQVRHHAERNAVVPVATITLLNVGQVVGGALVVETVFSYPGLGRLIYDSVIARDYPVLQGTFLLLVITVIIANLVNDLIYPWLDPRIRSGTATR